MGGARDAWSGGSHAEWDIILSTLHNRRAYLPRIVGRMLNVVNRLRAGKVCPHGGRFGIQQIIGRVRSRSRAAVRSPVGSERMRRPANIGPTKSLHCGHPAWRRSVRHVRLHIAARPHAVARIGRHDEEIRFGASSLQMDADKLQLRNTATTGCISVLLKFGAPGGLEVKLRNPLIGCQRRRRIQSTPFHHPSRQWCHSAHPACW